MAGLPSLFSNALHDYLTGRHDNGLYPYQRGYVNYDNYRFSIGDGYIRLCVIVFVIYIVLTFLKFTSDKIGPYFEKKSCEKKEETVDSNTQTEEKKIENK